MSILLRSDDEYSLEQWHYILHRLEEKLRFGGYSEHRYPSQRSPDGSMTDSLNHAIYVAHEAQFAGSLDSVRSAVGFIHGIMWSWGLASEARLVEEMSKWLVEARGNAVKKLTGGESGVSAESQHNLAKSISRH